MKACFYNQFGSSEVLKIGELPVPKPSEHEVQVKIMYAGCNPVDWKIRDGRLQAIQPYIFPIVPGWDGAGIVTLCGSKVADFKVGDFVFGDFRRSSAQWGTYAEYSLANEKHLIKKDQKLDFKTAASLPIAFSTAWEALFDVLKMKKNEVILIHAGAGGVGNFAIQLAFQYGVEVITTARVENHEYLHSLGAKHCIDYTQTSFEEEVHKLYPNGIEMVLDSIGKKGWNNVTSYMKPQGRLVSIVDRSVRENIPPSIRASHLFMQPRQDMLQEAQKRIISGTVRVPPVEEHPLSSAILVQNRLQEGHVRGKLVIKIG